LPHQQEADDRAPTLRGLGLTVEQEALVRRLPLFAGIEPQQLARLLAGAAVRRVERNSVLFIQGEEAALFFVVLEGWVRLWRQTPDGQESTIHVFGRGESFAEAALLESGRYPVTASAITRARLLAVPSADFLQQIRHSPDLALNLLATMSRHLRQLVQQVEQLTSRSSAERLVEFLLRLCPPGETRAEIELPLDKGLIAARLGMRPETLSRSLAKLRPAGVEVRGSRILIADVAKLRHLAQRHDGVRAILGR
jgi:CRP-like cAMP-binding protein